MPQPIPFAAAAARTDRVVVYCMSCGRSTWTMAGIIQARFGWLPYGVLTGVLHCKKGCGDRFGVVLPIDAPTPRAWVAKYGMPAPPPKQTRDMSAPEEHLRGSLVEIGKGGTFMAIHARATDDAILHWGFDHLLAKFSEGGRVPPRLAVTRGAMWSRDSQRDFKVVEARPNVEHPSKPGWQDADHLGGGPRQELSPRVGGEGLNLPSART